MHNTNIGTAVRNKPVWAAGFQMPVHAPLARSLETDVCIVGAGIAGLSTAYMLAKAGKKVVVLDDGGLCEGMTQFTTAHLSNAIDDRYIEIERLYGERGSRLAAHSHTSAVNQIEYIVEEEGIDCGFLRVDGYLFLAPGGEDDLLDREMHAARRAGLAGVRKLPRTPLDGFEAGPCLIFPGQGQFHPLRYLAGVARAIVRDGGLLYTNTHADRIEGGAAARVFAGRHVVTADSVVVATNSPVNDRLAIHTKQAGYMSYVIGARIPVGSVPSALYWDTDDPYHYVRVEAAPPGEQPPADENAPGDENPPGYEYPSGAGTHDLLIVGGEDHRVGQADDAQERYGRLESWARLHFPMMEDVEFEWAGQVMETVDGLAYIGRNPLDSGNVFIATGDSGMGMTHGTIAGMLLTDLILGRENPWAELYDPSRKTLSVIGTYLKENINTAVQFGDWLTPAGAGSEDEIALDSGAILRQGLSKVAAYRDRAGQLFKYSAICPHLGGIVRWNPEAKSWDCPCHGSRFDKFGVPIMGPANAPLSPIETDVRKDT